MFTELNIIFFRQISILCSHIDGLVDPRGTSRRVAVILGFIDESKRGIFRIPSTLKFKNRSRADKYVSAAVRKWFSSVSTHHYCGQSLLEGLANIHSFR